MKHPLKWEAYWGGGLGTTAVGTKQDKSGYLGVDACVSGVGVIIT